jgi:hypothetical protein
MQNDNQAGLYLGARFVKPFDAVGSQVGVARAEIRSRRLV